MQRIHIYPNQPPVVVCPRGRGYGLTNFLGDLFMTGATCGFWLIWVVIREVRR